MNVNITVPVRISSHFLLQILNLHMVLLKFLTMSHTNTDTRSLELVINWVYQETNHKILFYFRAVFFNLFDIAEP